MNWIKEQTINKFKELWCRHDREMDDTSEIEGYTIVGYLIESFDEIDGGWIKVKDRLPENAGWYLTWVTNVAYGYEYYEMLYYNDDKKWMYDIFYKAEFEVDTTIHFITHWMPLPDKPEE